MKAARKYLAIPLHLAWLYVFWMLMFALGRAVFLVVYWHEDMQNGFGSLLASFYHAIPLDTSAACYLLLFTAIVLMFEAIVKHPSITVVRSVYIVLMLLLFVIINS